MKGFFVINHGEITCQRKSALLLTKTKYISRCSAWLMVMAILIHGVKYSMVMTKRKQLGRIGGKSSVKAVNYHPIFQVCIFSVFF